MMIIYKADDGSLFELEEMGSGGMRARFQDGLTRAVAETTVQLQDYTSIARIMYECKEIAEAFRMGTPNSSAPNQRLLQNQTKRPS